MLEKNGFNDFNNQRHLHLKYKFLVLFIVLLGSLLIFQCSLKSKESPTTNNGKKWRIGYYEGGPWVNYQGYFLGIIYEDTPDGRTYAALSEVQMVAQGRYQ